jgi:hypothetical protein
VFGDLEKQRAYGRMGTSHLLFQDIQELGVGKRDLPVFERKRADIVPRLHDQFSSSTFPIPISRRMLCNLKSAFIGGFKS